MTLGDHLDSLDKEHLIIGEIVEGSEIIGKLNNVLSNEDNRPYQDIRITHTVVLHDPFPDPDNLLFPPESPVATAEILESDYIAVDVDVQETKDRDIAEINEEIAAKEAEAQATILEMVGDLPDADAAPPENVLFVCKLNPVTTSEDLEIIFSRFGKINCAEVIFDRQTGNSLQYAFIEFEDKKSCEDAYFKMDNVLIDDRRIHVDFSQSVSKIQWQGKGTGSKVRADNSGKRDHKLNKFPNSRTSDKLYNNKSLESRRHEDKRYEFSRNNEMARERDNTDQRYYNKHKKYYDSKYDNKEKHNYNRNRLDNNRHERKNKRNQLHHDSTYNERAEHNRKEKTRNREDSRNGQREYNEAEYKKTDKKRDKLMDRLRNEIYKKDRNSDSESSSSDSFSEKKKKRRKHRTSSSSESSDSAAEKRKKKKRNKQVAEQKSRNSSKKKKKHKKRDSDSDTTDSSSERKRKKKHKSSERILGKKKHKDERH